MKAASDTFKAELFARTNLIVVDLVQVQLRSGTTYYWTLYDRDAHYNNQLWSSKPPVALQRSNLAFRRGVQSSTMTLTFGVDLSQQLGLLTLSGTIARERWRGAIVSLLRGINPITNPDGSVSLFNNEAVALFTGLVGQTTINRSQVRVQVDSPLVLLNYPYPRMYFMPQCRWRLYDAGCGLAQELFTYPPSSFPPYTVAEGSTAGILNFVGVIPAPLTDPPSPPLTDLPTGYFDQGVVRFLSGENINLVRTVQKSMAPEANQYRDVVKADRPCVYYPLAGDLDDASGNNLHGTVGSGTSVFAASDGPDGGGYAQFHDWAFYSSMPSPTYDPNVTTKPVGWPDGGEAVTVEFWFRIGWTDDKGNPGVPRWIFETAAGSVGNLCSGEALGTSWVQPHVTIPSTISDIRLDGSDVQIAYDVSSLGGTWVHVVAILTLGGDGSTLRLYVNGILSGVGTHVAPFTWSQLWIGRVKLIKEERPSGVTWLYYYGDLWGFAVYNYALSVDRIQTHYEAVTKPAERLDTCQLILFEPLPIAPAVGDSFRVSAGCDKTLYTCTNKFSNRPNFGGFPFTPEPEIGA